MIFCKMFIKVNYLHNNDIVLLILFGQFLKNCDHRLAKFLFFFFFMSIPPTRIVTVGQSSVGKTSLVRRLVEDVFNDNEIPTMGFTYQELITEYNGNRVILQFWDTAGQERYDSLTKNYFRDVDIAILVYDITAKETLLALRKWNETLNENNIVGENVFVVGSKTDLQGRNVETSEGENFANSIGANFIEVSSLDGDNIEALKYKLIEAAIKKTKSGSVQDHILLNNDNKKDKCSC